MLRSYIDEVVKELEIEGAFETEVPDVFTFPVDPDVSVMVKGDGDLFFYAILPPHQVKNEGELYQHLLRANLQGEGTFGALLGINEEGKNLVLSRRIQDPVDYKVFKDALEDFCNAVEFWLGEIKAWRAKVEEK